MTIYYRLQHFEHRQMTVYKLPNKRLSVFDKRPSKLPNDYLSTSPKWLFINITKTAVYQHHQNGCLSTSPKWLFINITKMTVYQHHQNGCLSTSPKELFINITKMAVYQHHQKDCLSTPPNDHLSTLTNGRFLKCEMCIGTFLS